MLVTEEGERLLRNDPIGMDFRSRLLRTWLSGSEQALVSYFMGQWTWYEWLGTLAPLLLFWLLWRIAHKRGETKLAQLSLAIFAYGLFQQIIALVVLGMPALIRLTPMQPMRFLHLIYVFLCLVGGALMGRYLLKAEVWRWAVFLVAANGGMFIAQRQLFAGTAHLEMPYSSPSSPWLEAFAWIRSNTPENAYFAVDPFYMAAPGEDYHSFRALAERSMLTDAIKDTAVVTQVPDWLRSGMSSSLRWLAGSTSSLRTLSGLSLSLEWIGRWSPTLRRAGWPVRGTMALSRSVEFLKLQALSYRSLPVLFARTNGFRQNGEGMLLSAVETDRCST